MLEKTEGTIKQATLSHTTHNEDKQRERRTKHRKLKRRGNPDPTINSRVNPGSRKG
jgi:hypothetical protein